MAFIFQSAGTSNKNNPIIFLNFLLLLLLLRRKCPLHCQILSNSSISANTIATQLLKQIFRRQYERFLIKCGSTVFRVQHIEFKSSIYSTDNETHSLNRLFLQFSEGKSETICPFCSHRFLIGSGCRQQTLQVCCISLGALFASIGAFLLVTVLLFAQTMWSFLWTGLFCGIGVGTTLNFHFAIFNVFTIASGRKELRY